MRKGWRKQERKGEREEGKDRNKRGDDLIPEGKLNVVKMSVLPKWIYYIISINPSLNPIGLFKELDDQAHLEEKMRKKSQDDDQNKEKRQGACPPGIKANCAFTIIKMTAPVLLHCHSWCWQVSGTVRNSLSRTHTSDPYVSPILQLLSFPDKESTAQRTHVTRSRPAWRAAGPVLCTLHPPSHLNLTTTPAVGTVTNSV